MSEGFSEGSEKSWDSRKCPNTRGKGPRRVQKSPGTVRNDPKLKQRDLRGLRKVLGQYEWSQHLSESPRRVQKSPGTVGSVPTLEQRVLGGFKKVLGRYEMTQN